MKLSLTGRTALVTGAATGIGRAIAVAMAEAGAAVAINDHGRTTDTAALAATIRAQDGRALAVDADVTDRTQVLAMIAQIADGLGPIDILVNNAGIVLVKPFLELSEADWDRILATDLKSVFLCCQAVLPSMLERGSGCIINIASELGYLGRALYAPYTAAKGGVITLTRSLAREFAPIVRVNAIAPGPVHTEMLESEMVITGHDESAGVPMGRIGRPEEIAATAVFLASDQASFFCGETLSPNGGILMK